MTIINPYIPVENVHNRLEDLLKDAIADGLDEADIVDLFLGVLKETTTDMVDAAYRFEGAPVAAYKAVLEEVKSQRHRCAHHPV